ncbi:hypothetical protein FFZ77_31930, partial [Streptomyces katsurahamanus]|nr:hypothetical protein [Streptomyces katsurahamanus]
MTLDIRADDRPSYDYKLLVPEQGRIPESLSRRYRDGDLASYTSKFFAQYPGQTSAWTVSGFRPYEFGEFTYFLESRPGHRARHFFLPDADNLYGQTGFNQWPYSRYG